MAFSNLTKALAVPTDATAPYVFDRFPRASTGGFPTLVVRHAGDGTPAYKRASWHAANGSRGRSSGNSVSEAKTKQRALDDARLLADHCVVSWTHVTDDEKQVAPCTPDNVFEFLSAIIESHEGLTIYLAFRSWAGEADNFRPAPAAGDVTELGKT
jgi:hypothetical protein